jgi:hypothetical protein
MSHKYVRLVAVVAILLAVHFVTLPAAHARGLAGSRATVHSADGFDAVLAWMAELLHLGHPDHTSGLSHQSSAITGGGTPVGGPRYTPNTGPCIDPNGGNCAK